MVNGMNSLSISSYKVRVRVWVRKHTFSFEGLDSAIYCSTTVEDLWPDKTFISVKLAPVSASHVMAVLLKA